MKTIKKIAPIYLVAEVRSKAFAIIMCIFVPIMVLVGLFMVYDGFFSSGSTNDGLIGLLGFIFFGGWGFNLLKGGDYKPQKSFYFKRFSKEKLKKYNVWGTLISLVVFVLIMFIQPEAGIKNIGYLIAGLSACYYMNKSIKVHEDVDYVANTQLADLIGLEIDEKVNASYQNFDSSDSSSIQKNSNILLVSDRKIFFAYYNGDSWFTITKKLEDIEKIGCLGHDDSKIYLKLVFTDKTKIGLRLDLYDKITSNPYLFIKRFLDTLDAYLLGYSISNRNSRRRVSIDTTPQTQHDTPQSSEAKEKVSAEATAVRQIEISDSIINEIKHGAKVEQGRTIEL